MNILAIDLGKFNSTCCFFNTQTQEYSFWMAATTRRYMRTVLEKHAIDLVVMEACGPSGWISDLCRELGLKVLVCSTNEEAWHWKHVKRKTEKDDRIRRLQTIPGVGRKTAEVLVTAIDDPHRFKNDRQFSAYIGLVPRQYQSGETNRNGRITKRGSRLLRTMLLECAWASLRYNRWAHSKRSSTSSQRRTAVTT